MKKIVYCIVLIILALYILLFPEPAIKAASYGLILWYTKMLPTLLPFAILSYIFVAAGILDSATKGLHKLIKHLLPISSAGIYPLIAGFLFGFPLGSKITADMVKEHQLDFAEGNRLFSICNNISPVFISGFILTTALNLPQLKLATFLILYLPPLVYFIVDTHISNKKQALPKQDIKKSAPRSQINFKIIDAGIMSGFETLTKLGGYIMLFAILSEITSHIPWKSSILQCMVSGITEITNGIAGIAASSLPMKTKYLLMILCTAWGGFSGMAQTASMIKDVHFSMKRYIKTKVICSVASGILAFLVIGWLF